MSRKIALIIAVVAWVIGGAIYALALTPKEKEKARKILAAVEAGIEHTKAVEVAADQASVSAADANAVALMAATSAFETGLKAKNALNEAERCKKENERMRPIVDAVTGPWWFPGGNALIYGAKKSAISAVVIIVGGFVLFLVIKFVLTLATGGTAGAALGAVGGIFGAFGRWLGRAGKRFLFFFRRRSTKAIDNIEHRTIGEDPPDPKP